MHQTTLPGTKTTATATTTTLPPPPRHHALGYKHQVQEHPDQHADVPVVDAVPIFSRSAIAAHDDEEQPEEETQTSRRGERHDENRHTEPRPIAQPSQQQQQGRRRPADAGASDNASAPTTQESNHPVVPPPAAVAESKQRRLFMGIILALLLIIVIIVASWVGVTNSAARQKKTVDDRSVNSENNTTGGDGGDVATGGDGGGTVAITGTPFSNSDYGFKFYQDLNQFHVYGSDGFPTVAADLSTTVVQDCLEFCADYEVAQFASSTTDDNPCKCYRGQDVACIVPAVSRDRPTMAAETTRRHKGQIYSKTALPLCEFDLCQAGPDDWFCFVAYQYAFRETGLPHNATVAKRSDTVTSENDCLIFCAEHDVAQYLPYSSGDACVCYDQVECVAQWDDQDINLISYVAQGTLFAKQGLSYCDVDYCALTPGDYWCFTGRQYDFETYWVYQSSTTPSWNATDSTMADSVDDCLKHCAPYVAVEYITQLIQKNRTEVWQGGNCLCYDRVECLVPMGRVNKTMAGSVYVKEDVQTCAKDYCTVAPDDDEDCPSVKEDQNVAA